MKYTSSLALLVAGALLLVGCGGATESTTEAPATVVPSPAVKTSKPAAQAAQAKSSVASLEKSCDDLFGNRWDNLVLRASQFLNEVEDMTEEDATEAKKLSRQLKQVMNNAEDELATPLRLVHEPIDSYVVAYDQGRGWTFDAVPFQEGGNEVIDICTPLLGNIETAQDAAAQAEAEAAAEAKAAEEAEAAAKAEAEAKAAAEAEAAKAKAEAGTISQQNALRHAGQYLDSMAFSRSGLIDQLIYEEYSVEDATWAVDRVTVDWNEQAARHAKQYLDSMAFSRQGLLDQLLYEGYTPEQAEYGVSKTGL